MRMLAKMPVYQHFPQYAPEGVMQMELQKTPSPVREMVQVP
jgi:hypothetical protein